MKVSDVKIGDKLYISDCDDCCGGLATVEYIMDNFNNTFVSFSEIGFHIHYNLKHLLEEQDELSEDYKGMIAKRR